MGGAGGEALVDEGDGDLGAGLQVGCEAMDFEGPGAEVAGEMERVADEDFGDFVFADEAEDGADVFVAVLAMDGDERLGGVAERVGEGDADADFADVERHDAGGEHKEKDYTDKADEGG